MEFSQRVVTAIPLDQVWTANGALESKRGRHLGREDVRSMLRSEKIQLVVADCGLPLNWIPETEMMAFWKSEVTSRLIEPPGDKIFPEDYPGGYCFLASEWRVSDGNILVVLEKYH